VNQSRELQTAKVLAAGALATATTTAAATVAPGFCGAKAAAAVLGSRCVLVLSKNK